MTKFDWNKVNNPVIQKEYTDSRSGKEMVFLSYTEGRTRKYANVRKGKIAYQQMFNNPDKQVVSGPSVPFLVVFQMHTKNVENGTEGTKLYKYDGRMKGNIGKSVQTIANKLQAMFSLSKH